MNQRLRVVIACQDAAGIRLLKSVMASGYTIAGVLSVPDSLSISCPYRFATDNGLQIWHADNAREESFAAVVHQERVDLILSIRFPFIFDKKVIDAPRIGTFNLHTGLLPEYAGANVSSWVIYNGESRHGVTLHKMVAAIDAGPIVDQAGFGIRENDTGLTLTRKSINFGLSMADRFLERVSTGEEISLIPQNLELRKYYREAIPQQGCIHWEDNAKNIANFVRACDYYPLPSPWGLPQAIFGNEKLSICRCSVPGSTCRQTPGFIRVTSDQEVEVATGDKWLRLELIKYRERFIHPAAILKGGEHLENGRPV